MTRYSIIGATISGNHGAEAMLSTTVAELRVLEPEAEIAVFSYYPGADRDLVKSIRIYSATPLASLWHCAAALLHRAGFRVLPLPEALRFLKSSAVLVDIQGVSFNDGRLKYLPYKITTLLPALLLGIRVVKLAQSVGPFRQWPNRIAAGALLKHCALVVARGDRSYGYTQALGLHNAMNAPDITFCFNAESGLSSEGMQAIGAVHGFCARQGKVLALSPSAVVFKKMRSKGLDYIGLLNTLVQQAKRAGYGVVVFANASRYGAGLRNNDLPVIDLLRKQAGEDGIYYCTEVLSARAVEHIVQEADAAILSRFHAMIACLRHAVPCMVVGWGHKYTESMEAFGLGELVCDYADTEACSRIVQQVLQSPSELKAHMQERLPEITAQSRAQFQALKALLGSA